MRGAFPRTGLFWSREPIAAEVATSIGALPLDAKAWARLRAGGPRALSPDHEAWARACAPPEVEREEGAAEIARLRKAMLDAVVPPAIAGLSLACTVGLALFAAGFLWPETRRWAFALAFVVVLLMVLWASLRALVSSRRQRVLQEELFEVREAQRALEARGERPHLLRTALGIDADKIEETRGRWDSPLADPDRLLLVSRALMNDADLTWLAGLVKARAILVEGGPGLPSAQEVSLDHPAVR